jgi:hypothetical protein
MRRLGSSSLSGHLAILLNVDVFVGLEDGDVVVGVLDTEGALIRYVVNGRDSASLRESLDQSVFVFDSTAVLTGCLLSSVVKYLSVSPRSLNHGIARMVRAYFSSSS